MNRFLRPLSLVPAMLFCAVMSLALCRVALVQTPQQGEQPAQQDSSGQKKSKKNQDNNGNANSASQNNSTNNGSANSQPANSGNAANGSGKPAPLFGGTLTLKSSRQTKDTATMGFNGVDPNGQVQQSFLNAAPTSDDMAKAQRVAQYQVTSADLSAFLQQGDLNSNTPSRKSK